MFQKQYLTYSIYGLLFITLYFIFFQHLDSFHIRNWDEAMFAVNAYEMNQNHHFIVPHFNNFADMWNSKPPLQIWIQVLFIKLIGYNELAIRLPSALASSFSAITLFFFFKKRTSLIFALSVFFVFVTSSGVSTFHTGRTGDADALLSFFILCYIISFYKWLFENNEKAIFSFFIYLTLAILTKSIAALLFIPAIVFLVFYFKKFNPLLSNKWLYIGFFPCILLSLGYFYVRDFYQNGYISYILNNDIGRVNKAIESHLEPFDFYLNKLFNGRFLWFVLVLPGAYTLWINKKTKSYAIFLVSLFICYFIIISYSTTKLEWYDLPLFPILSVFSAYVIFKFISKINVTKKSFHTSLLLIFVFILPIYFSSRSSYKSEIPSEEKKIEILTEYAFKNSKNTSLNSTVFLTHNYDRALFFYKYKLNTKGMDFKITHSEQSLNPNDIVLVAEDSLKIVLKQKYNIQTIDSFTSVLKVKIKSLK